MLRSGIPGFPVNFDFQYVKISKKQVKDFHLYFATKMCWKFFTKSASGRTESNETSTPEFNINLIHKPLKRYMDWKENKVFLTEKASKKIYGIFIITSVSYNI